MLAHAVPMVVGLLASPAAGMAFGLRTFGRRIMMSAKGRGQLYEDITKTIGNTPVVKVSDKLCPPDVDLYVKCEYFNPLSSVKDRLALAIIQDAEARGDLKPGDTVVEATSGNTGIAVAMVCAQRGYDCVICMAEPFSVERRKLMRMLGAKVIVTPKAGKGTGMVRKAEELCAKHGWFLCHQFENEANWKFHEETTGPEILADFEGKKLDYWVTGYGTGGTFHGAGKAIKAARPDVKIVLAEPADAGLLVSGVPTERNADGSPKESHPAFKPHPIQGWTPDFIRARHTAVDRPNRRLLPRARPVARGQSRARRAAVALRGGFASTWACPLTHPVGAPFRACVLCGACVAAAKVLEDAPMPELMEELVSIPGAEAIATAKLLASKEGLLTGISGGGTMWAALETAKKAPKGSVILAMLPDTGERCEPPSRTIRR
jgi:cysteine synthase A